MICKLGISLLTYTSLGGKMNTTNKETTDQGLEVQRDDTEEE